MSNNPIDKHYESLSKLYLRLKGYFVTNLIIHSEDPGKEKTELDIVATRMPKHSQEYRRVEVNDYLESSNSRIEILVSEVKNYKNLDSVEFNKGLRKDELSIKQLVNWIGVYDNFDEQVKKFGNYLNLHRTKDWNGFAEFDGDFKFGKYRFKFTFFCPSLTKWNGSGFKYIHGEEMFDFIWECLNETKRIETSSRRYSFRHWNELEKYVTFFKGKDTKVTKDEFEEYCKSLKTQEKIK